MRRTFAYDPERVSVIVGGEIITDFPKGTLIQVSMTAKQFSYTPGLASGVRTYDPNKHGTIRISILQGSPSNLILDKYLQADINPTTVGYFPLIINDNNAINGNVSWLCKAPTCWVAQYPDWTLADGQNTKTWTLETNAIDYHTLAPNSDIHGQSGSSVPPDVS